MIHGKIETFKTECGNFLHRGSCVTKDESVTAGEVMSAQVPDAMGKGFERVTLKWLDVRDADGVSRCEFEILDRRPST